MHRLSVLILCLTVILGLTVVATPHAEAADAPPQQGDLLVANHDVEAGLSGWEPRRGRSAEPLLPACGSSVSLETSAPLAGTASLRLVTTAACREVGVEGSPVPVTSGTRYAAWATSTVRKGNLSLGLRWYDAAGRAVGTDWSERSSSDDHPPASPVKFMATAPAGAISAAVVVSVIGEAVIDTVLVSAQVTDLGHPVKISGVANGTAYGIDPATGRDTAYTVVTGAHGVAARLVGIDVLSAAVVLDIAVPGAMGAWNATSTPDGRIWISAYNYADAGVGGRLFSYTPGAAVVVDHGAPDPRSTFTYAATGTPDGSVYGGTYPSGALWRFDPATGSYTTLAKPILPGIQYVRSVGFDASTGLVFAGTAGTAHIVACTTDGARCAEVLPTSYAHYAWVYNLSADDGRVMARVTDDHGDDHLVVVKVWQDATGAIRSELEADLAGLSFPGVSNAVDGKVYYAKSTRLFSYDMATRTETDLGTATGIFARQWKVIRLVDQVNHPGWTVVGTNSGGIIARYNLTTGRFETNRVTALPKAVADVETIVGGPDGRIYSSGYLVGGLGIHEPMRSDRNRIVGTGYGQAEGLTTLGDRVFFGIYPGAHLQSATPAQMAAGQRPTNHCDIGNGQDRPYGMLGHQGKVYAGTMAVYGQTSGALTILDPVSNECTVLRDVVPNQSVVSLTAAAGRIYGGSLIWGGLGSVTTAKEAVLLEYDPGTRAHRTIALPVRDLRAVTAITTAPDGKVWMLAENHLLCWDPATSSWVAARNAFPDIVYPRDTTDGGRIGALNSKLITTRDGRIFGVIAQRYFFQLDPADGRITILHRGAVQTIAEDGYGNLYMVNHANGLLRYVPEGLAR